MLKEISYIPLLFILLSFFNNIITANPSGFKSEQEFSVHRLNSRQQLVEWELLANSALGPNSFTRMARAIIIYNEKEDLPKELWSKIDHKVFMEKSYTEQINMLKSELSLEELQQLSILSAKAPYFEVKAEKYGELIQVYDWKDISPLAKGLLTTLENGQLVYRWFIHPLSPPELSELFLFTRDIYQTELEVQLSDVRFNFTSSRSILVFSEQEQKFISLKLSLLESEGPFKAKGFEHHMFETWVKFDEYFRASIGSKEIPGFKILREPYALSSATIRDGLIARDYHSQLKDKYYLPAFSALDEKVGREIALINGETDPFKFWTDYLIVPLAEGFAALRALTGVEHTSPHSQNILIELDKNFKPTGSIILRDFDFLLDKLAYEKVSDVSKIFINRYLVRFRDNLNHSFSLINGLGKRPSWLSESEYQSWVETYFKNFRIKYSEISGLTLGKIFSDQAIYTYIDKERGLQNAESAGFNSSTINNSHQIMLNSEVLEGYYKDHYLEALARFQQGERVKKPQTCLETSAN